MNNPDGIFLGLDCGASTSKVGAIDAYGKPLTHTLMQAPTRASEGAATIIQGWMQTLEAFLQKHERTWDAVRGVGLAIPGPYRAYGVLGPMPNMPASLDYWHFFDDLSAAIATAAGRDIPVCTANDGQLAGVPEAHLIQQTEPGSVLMLAPGTGLGCSFVDSSGKLFAGDHQASAILAHMPAPHALLGLPALPCGCGRTWGCFEVYTTLSGLPQLLNTVLELYPDHPFHTDPRTDREKAFALRGMAQEGDALALELFDLQARALGYAVATAAMAYDPSHVVIGGGLMDTEATTESFRQRYLKLVWEAYEEMAWEIPAKLTLRPSHYGELSQALGAALLARFEQSAAS